MLFKDTSSGKGRKGKHGTFSMTAHRVSCQVMSTMRCNGDKDKAHTVGIPRIPTDVEVIIAELLPGALAEDVSYAS